jgi:DNA protecting protein DprA
MGDLRAEDLFFLFAMAEKIQGTKLKFGELLQDLSVRGPYTLGQRVVESRTQRVSMEVNQKHCHRDYWRNLWDSLHITGESGGLSTAASRSYFSKFADHIEKISEASAEHCSLVLENKGAILFSHHLYFPPLLKTTNKCPRFITCVGDLERLRDPLVSIVGSRKANRKALHESYRTGYELTKRGISIVSGGAFGCDIASHEGALAWENGPCRAIVVFAGGLGCLYPAAHRPIFAQILARGGCLISERLWNAKPYRSDFPVRNRLIAGMAGLLLLMQAGELSGAMITARLGLDYGSDIAVLNHDPYDVRAIGGQSLIEQGAFSFERVEDLIPILQGQRTH